MEEIQSVPQPEKKLWIKKYWFIPVILLAAAALIAVFFDSILDILPIDQSGWREKNGVYRYADEDGDPITGWKTVEDITYYFSPDMLTGICQVEGDTYCFSQSGALQTGWQEQGGNWYYFHPEDGTMALSWTQIDGYTYYFNRQGHMARYWQALEQGDYYFTSSGRMVTGWQTIGADRYCFSEEGLLLKGWQELDGKRYYLGEDGIMATGWVETDEGTVFLQEDGTLAEGWVENEEGLSYFLADGTRHTGWLTLEDGTYYLDESGIAAIGRAEIDGGVHYFTSTGAKVLLVNRWNPVPEGYEVNLTTLPNGREIDASCYDDLMAMMEACEAASCHPSIIDAYRTNWTQYNMFYGRISSYVAQGYDEGMAYYLTLESVAVPGTSEHELGLAIDVSELQYTDPETDALTWLAEHCWEYGWILRYPEEKKHITGIMYEPWHFRYVGKTLALELRDSGLCLEEYLESLTADGTLCGNPDRNPQ